ncbi:MAG TPA: NUDIX domain-containing protein [Stellaceae bacterium]|nr:NUDIX domain-containing protein [Stellaceae bacterium]
MSDPRPIARDCAVALMVTPDGRYLMQLRDADPAIPFPDHWACFGGSIEPGEDVEAALRRELIEELDYRAGAVTFFTEMVVDLPFAPPRTDRMHFFAVPIAADAVDHMVQREGAGRRLFTPEAIAAEPRVAPWDLCAVLMHARRGALFAPALPAGAKAR